MKVNVEIQDKEKKRTYSGIIEVPTDSSLIGPFELSDTVGNKFPVKVRSDLYAEVQLIFDYDGKRLSVGFCALEIGKKKTIPGGLGGKDRILELPKSNFAKTPLRVSVTRLPD